MFDKIISFSIKNKLVIGLFVLALIGWGTYSLNRIPLDAVPDITNNQVQVITQAPDLATQEVEQFITYPLELSLSFIPNVEEIRSISRFGLSVITIVFEEDVDPYLARQLVSEQIRVASEDIPEGYGSPQLAPMVTGLSEIYQYTLVEEPGYDTVYSPMELRTIQDWIVKRQLAGVPGVAEVSSLGGYLKQYEVSLDPEKLRAYRLTVADLYNAIEKNNQNTGGSYIEKTNTTYFIRGEGMVSSLDEIRNVLIKNVEGTPVLIGDVATVQYGYAPRFGAMTRNGEGETVGGLVLMLKGENSYQVTQAVKERVEQIQKSLPEGIHIEPFLDRSDLIDRAIATVTRNLIEGGLIVIFVLVLLLGNLRAGLVVASVIPLSMLFALGMMHVFGVSANLMSLGAIDFGLIVDGAVIIVEAIIHRIYGTFNGQRLTQNEMDQQVGIASKHIRKSAAFGEIIILIVYLPILALVGIEGKTFRPMAQTVSFAILGAFILSLTYVPMMTALVLKKDIVVKRNISDKIMDFFHRLYEPVIRFALGAKKLVILTAILLFAGSLFLFSRLGGEFIPTLEEGDIASHQILPTGTSLKHMVAVSEKIQVALMREFPEVKEVVTKIGTSEIPTDPMAMELADIIIVMKDKEEWVSASSREEMFEKMEAVINTVPGVGTEFTQPIQMRFNELITGVRQDIAVKIYGEDLDVLFEKGNEASQLISSIEGVGGTVVEQVTGLPQIQINYKRNKMAQYGLDVEDVNKAINTAFAGGAAGVVFEGERRFDLVVRFQEDFRQDIDNVQNMYIPLPSGGQVPIKEVANVRFEEAPAQISRDDAKRRIVVGINTRNRDTESVVEDIQQVLDEQLNLPPGYYITYGGQFENLIEARERLSVAVPVALLLILVLLFFTFNSIKQALLIFTAVPMSAIGGILALWLRDMPFSISAGVGFIALFGVAVLNGIVLISEFNSLKKEGVESIRERILRGTHTRLRPVIMTASVASLGFLPMAISTSAGAEVQQPLATVVIGGLITATLLTLVVLPVLYYYLEKGLRLKAQPALLILFVLSGTLLSPTTAKAQEGEGEVLVLTLEQAIQTALANYPGLEQAELQVAQQKALKKTAFDFGRTSLYHQREETNGEEFRGVESYGVQQQLEFPTTYLRELQYRKEQVEQSIAYRNLSANELVAEVSQAYNEWLLAESKLRIVQGLDSLYQDFEAAASLRFETGETGKLEMLSASSQAKRVAVRLEQALADYRAATLRMQTWLNTEAEIASAQAGLYRFATPPVAEDGDLLQNPLLAYYAQNVDVATAAYKVARSKFLPQINLGYSDQTVNGLDGFYLYRVGVDIPLLFFAQKGRTQAARIQRTLAEKELEEKKLALQREWAAAMAALQKAEASLSFYEKEGLQLAEEQIRTARFGYKEGAVDYLAYIQNLDQATVVQEEYLQSLQQYNLAIIELNRLAGDLAGMYDPSEISK
ncbi:cobalt-zinc-cadmium resistance protein CzcA [Pontibacter ummariensis]|uniref:Cobalt-zinc-cadmium resistance protein CzcA n=1 Tax=Pontibacter ummariensis TaxID=1610492 RepID=A0A239D982_9BACT|nr:CusA/CzcA family heavy metal efflux RND transporter [Pontibacter ummariensis]PRY14312.1 cobalt-zinc-cadmium resistance protein CzcA [Pontibacter ummariensis]SNS28895.1 cobalt-zinc-cadmium resistance protein CzcA [Pontibacter ummariensis]